MRQDTENESTYGPRRHYTAAQLLAMDETKASTVLKSDFGSLVTVAIAEAASGDTPAHLRTLLRSDDWCERWLDALRCAESSLGCDLERMRYLDDPRALNTESRLRAVRRRKIEAASSASAASRRRTDASLDVERTALNWLCGALPHDFSRHLDQVAAESPSGAPEGSREDASQHARIIDAWRRGLLGSPATESLRRLLALPGDAFRDVVAEDAKHQNYRNDDLRHPVLLTRWRDAVTELLANTAALACAQDAFTLGRLHVDLWEFPEEHARKILNGRRFFAALMQRRAEVNRLIHDALAVVDSAAPTEAQAWWRAVRENARARLAADRPDAVEFIRTALRAYCADDPDRIDPARLPSDARGRLKTHVIASVGSGDLDLGRLAGAGGRPAGFDGATIRARTAHAIASMDMALCHRTTIRAFLPSGASVTKQFGVILQRFESEALIERGREFIQVLDRQRLQEIADAEIEQAAGTVLDLAAVLAAIERDLREASSDLPRMWREQRRLELERIRRLMTVAPAAQPRIVHRTGRQERLEVGEHRLAQRKKPASAPVSVRQGRPKLACETCHGKPPRGFTCQACGESGAQ